ncbi:uncharacterized protein M6B38_128300 [Iris pallida]|uniref:BZIP domain-containing protein n=1 Tax=Iris pallida TaxID=29817 RepID=A0AAX6G6J4_IRIPA|nr:uncharacterized protein M6B38_128300 [Iris pallida]
MSSSRARQTSSSEGGSPKLDADQKKRKRMISNRDSARRSRQRKQQHVDDLIKQSAQLQSENTQIAMRVDLCSQHYLKVESENTVLRNEVMELTEKLRSLNSVLQFVEDFSGMELEKPEIPDPLLKPWQLPCPGHPIMASANMFQF